MSRDAGIRKDEGGRGAHKADHARTEKDNAEAQRVEADAGER
jgi:hypothetical protein